MVVVFETHIIIEGAYADCKNAEFLLAFFAELLTVIVVPVALRMFKTAWVRNNIMQKREAGLLKTARLRMLILVLPMILNVALYYLFMNVAFGYMAIILFISLAFIYPSKGRCEAELEVEE